MGSYSSGAGSSPAPLVSAEQNVGEVSQSHSAGAAPPVLAASPEAGSMGQSWLLVAGLNLVVAVALLLWVLLGRSPGAPVPPSASISASASASVTADLSPTATPESLAAILTATIDSVATDTIAASSVSEPPTSTLEPLSTSTSTSTPAPPPPTDTPLPPPSTGTSTSVPLTSSPQPPPTDTQAPPTDTAVPPTPVPPTSTFTPIPPPPPPPPPPTVRRAPPTSTPIRYVRYVVRPGDNLITIAARYGTTVDAIMRANNLRSTLIYAGQVLIIPLR